LWQCSTCFAGKKRRITAEEESLSKAKGILEDWFLQLRGKLEEMSPIVGVAFCLPRLVTALPVSGIRNSVVELNTGVGQAIVGSWRPLMSEKLGFQSVGCEPLINLLSGHLESPGKSYIRIKRCKRFVLSPLC
jgi:hypothetical protein